MQGDLGGGRVGGAAGYAAGDALVGGYGGVASGNGVDVSGFGSVSVVMRRELDCRGNRVRAPNDESGV